MYDKLLERLTPKIRIGTGIVLLVAAFVRQQFSEEVLDMYAYYFAVAAALCFAHIIVCKIAKTELDAILFVVMNVSVIIVGFALAWSEYIKGPAMYAVGGMCLAVDWIINAWLIQYGDILKKIVAGFAITLAVILLVAVLFVGPVLFYIFL